MIFFSNFKACLKEKRGAWRFSAVFFFSEVDGMFFPDILRVLVCFSRIFCWDDFQMSHMKINKNMKMHALLDEQKRTSSMRHWSYDVTTERKSLWSKSPPEIENCSFCFTTSRNRTDMWPKRPNRPPNASRQTSSEALVLPVVCEICWLVVHRCFISNDVQSETA